MGDINIDVNFSGPIFDEALAGQIVFEYCRHLEEVLAEDGSTRIKAYLPEQYMYLGHNGGDPTHNPVPDNAGYLVSSVYTERARVDMMLISYDWAWYGAWIEGVAEKNAMIWPGRIARGLSGRFPGYHTFRIISEQLNAEAVSVAERELPPYLARLNG